MESRPVQGLMADKSYFQEYFHTVLAQKLMQAGINSGERIGVGISGSPRPGGGNELIDALSEERGLTPEEESRIAQQERDSKTTKLFHGLAEIGNWRQQMVPLESSYSFSGPRHKSS